MRRIVAAGLFFLFLITGTSLAENWPAWRGVQGIGISGERHLPSRFSSVEKVLWKAPLPDSGNSTPIVWDNHVFDVSQ